MNSDHSPKTSFIRRLRAWSRRQKAASAKRRAEYLHLGGDNRRRRLLISLHPESLFSFFTSRAGAWWVFKVCVTVFLLSCLAVTFAYFYYRSEAPATILELQSCVEGQVTQFYDRSGQTLLWTTREGGECERVSLDDVSPYFVDGLITIEDKDFFEHPGFKVTSIARAVINNLRGQPLQGGSTITQQYVKNAVLRDSERSYERKIKEIILVPEIESLYSKEEILTAYLNTIFLGSFYNGIEAASKGYFDKSASELTLDESALLVATVSAPNVVWNEPELHLRRRNIVLNEMLKAGKINEQQHREALAVDTLAKIKRQTDITSAAIIAPYFVSTASQYLEGLVCQRESQCEKFAGGGYKVITTLDLKKQRSIEAIVRATATELEENGFDNAAALVIDNQTKEVLALAGGRDFQQPDFGQINQAAWPRAPRQLWHGLIYATLLDKNTDWGAGRTLYDYPTFSQLSATESLGPVSLRRALGESILTPTAKAAYLAGDATVAELARELGLADLMDCQNACAARLAVADDFISHLDHLANFYAALGDEGRYQATGYIREIRDSTGETIYLRERESYHAFKPQTAYMINDILSDSAFKPAGLNRHANLAFKSAASADFNDNPFVAYTPRLTLGGWVGRQILDNGQADNTATDVRRAQSRLVEIFLQEYSGETGLSAGWSQPAGLKQLRTNLTTGKIGTGAADYYAGDFQADNLEATTFFTIDTTSGKLANACTPPDALKETSSEALVPELPADNPAYDDWMRPILVNLGSRLDSTIPAQIDDLHTCDAQPPSLKVSSDGDCRRACTLTIEAVAGTHDLQSISINANEAGFREILIAVDGRAHKITYPYSGSSNRRAVIVKITDEALYSASQIVSF